LHLRAGRRRETSPSALAVGPSADWFDGRRLAT